MQTIIKQVICPVWGKICVTPYKRSAVRGKRPPQTTYHEGVVYTITRSTPPGSCSVRMTSPRAALRLHGAMHIKPHSGF